MNQSKNKIIAGHIPVLHKGYLDILNNNPERTILLFDHTITNKFDDLRKDIRVLDVDTTINALRGLGYQANSINQAEFDAMLGSSKVELLLLDDHISRTLVSKVSTNLTFTSPFLRWDRRSIIQKNTVKPDRYIDGSSDIVQKLYSEASKSTDWWRHVGAAIIDNSTVILSSYNRSIPHEHITSIEGDPRAAANQGSSIENSLFIHAEGDLIAKLARLGISSEGKSIYVTTFPCPNCAKLIAASGIQKCYFIDGYATLDGERTLRSANVEIVQITKPDIEEDESRFRPYPTKVSD